MARPSFLACVNEVLIKLREPTVISYDANSYSYLIATLMNHALSDVEKAFRWPDLYTEEELSLVSGTAIYSLTDWQDKGRIDKIVNQTMNYSVIHPISDDRWVTLNHDADNGIPTYWRLYPADSNGDPRLQFYRTPDDSYTVSVSGWVGQASVWTNGVAIKVPTRPVIMRAYAMAIQERGEDTGISYSEADEAAAKALYDAIEREEDSRRGSAVPVWSIG